MTFAALRHLPKLRWIFLSLPYINWILYLAFFERTDKFFQSGLRGFLALTAVLSALTLLPAATVILCSCAREAKFAPLTLTRKLILLPTLGIFVVVLLCLTMACFLVTGRAGAEYGLYFPGDRLFLVTDLIFLPALAGFLAHCAIRSCRAPRSIANLPS